MEKLFLSYQDIESYAQNISREILLNNWRPDCIVGITRGGLLPAVLLSQYLKVPMTSLDFSLRDNTEIPNQTNTWLAEDAISHRKNILIVDDINDTGATLRSIMADWQSSCCPKSPDWSDVWCYNVRFAVMVNNEASEFELCDYEGMTINKLEKDVWVQFPWEEWWINK